MTLEKKLFFPIIALVITGLMIVPGLLLRATVDINSLTEYEATVNYIGLTKIRLNSGGRNEIIYLELQGLDQLLGINHLTDDDHNFLLKTIMKFDTVKVFFDASGKQVGEGINLHVYQLEHNGSILIDIADVNRKHYLLGQLFLWTGVFFMFCLLLFYIIMRKKNRKNSSRL